MRAVGGEKREGHSAGEEAQVGSRGRGDGSVLGQRRMEPRGESAGLSFTCKFVIYLIRWS